MRHLWWASLLAGVWTGCGVDGTAADFQPVAVVSEITRVQPGTGIVLWDDSENRDTDAIQLEFSYVGFNAVVRQRGEYDWSAIEQKLAAIAGRKHQAILRFYDTYPGKPTTVPDYIKNTAGYREITALSEGQTTGFPDWSHPEYQRFQREFFEKFAAKYDRDPRLAFLQVGFGLWSEYHIYDGPEELGRTFPSHQVQADLLRQLGENFRQTPWMISIDAADEARTPFAKNRKLLELSFGVFDDSFLCQRHQRENVPNWNFFGRDRWQYAPAGGEFSYYTEHDQQRALAPKGPHGIRFEDAAREFHLSFIIGSDQPNHAGLDRVREAGRACGYRLRLKSLESDGTTTRGVIENIGIAPLYYDAWPASAGVRSQTTLKGLLPRQETAFTIAAPTAQGEFTINGDRLVPGQTIQFEARLPSR